jgi:hypothetical protein
MALAAERRILAARSTSGGVPILVRCHICGLDISGKVPFVAFDLQFCSPLCIRQHRSRMPQNSTHHWIFENGNLFLRICDYWITDDKKSFILRVMSWIPIPCLNFRICGIIIYRNSYFRNKHEYMKLKNSCDLYFYVRYGFSYVWPLVT